MRGLANSSNPAFLMQPVELLQRLIQYNTTNPPGNEVECMTFIGEVLTQAGIPFELLERSPQRPNLVARLAGQGQAAPLLLYGHVDVVTTTGQDWQHPPFSGIEADDYIWGRGALDMKGGVAMMISSLLRARQEEITPPGDVILAVVCDEEHGGDFGAKFLVENHADLFTGVKYALGEFGGFTMYIGQQRFYPIMIAEKQFCILTATLRGPGGHGSMPIRGGAMTKLSRFIYNLETHRLPVHITLPAQKMIHCMADALPAPTGLVMRQLLTPALTDVVLNVLGERGRPFDPLLHNTVSATMVQGGDKFNVIPAEISLCLDGRLLPGYQPDVLLAELRQIVGSEVEWEIVRYDPGPAEVDLALFDYLGSILTAADPQGVPVPFLLSGVTDGRFFSRLGIQTYGFIPMKLPAGFNFTQTIHAANERIPVEAVNFGTHALYQAIQSFQ